MQHLVTLPERDVRSPFPNQKLKKMVDKHVVSCSVSRIGQFMLEYEAILLTTVMDRPTPSRKEITLPATDRLMSSQKGCLLQSIDSSNSVWTGDNKFTYDQKNQTLNIVTLF